MSEREWLEVEVQEHTTGTGDVAYFVYWQTCNAYGSMGVGMSRREAEDLAHRMRAGEIKP